jgi:putative protease
MTHVELLSPAGDFEKMQMALHYGADAVYAGGRLCNLRALSDNFSDAELFKAIRYAHSLGKKLFVTLNAVPYDDELNEIPAYARRLQEMGTDAVIVSDLGVFEAVRESSTIPIHVSTQASATNARSVRMWQNLGATRVVLARELSLDQITRIRNAAPDIELEVFAHGAMCISISGRCFLSNWLTGRDANQGACTHTCRWEYSLVEEKRPGQFFPVADDERGGYILNSRDLCTIPFLDKLLATGINSLKIEGRMKGIYYAAITASVYRRAISAAACDNYQHDPLWIEELLSASPRPFTSGFFLGRNNDLMQETQKGPPPRNHLMVAKVRESFPERNEAILEVRNRIAVRESIEKISPNTAPTLVVATTMRHEETGEPIEVAHPGTIVRITTQTPLAPLDLLRTPSAL